MPSTSFLTFVTLLVLKQASAIADVRNPALMNPVRDFIQGLQWNGPAGKGTSFDVSM